MTIRVNYNLVCFYDFINKYYCYCYCYDDDDDNDEIYNISLFFLRKKNHLSSSIFKLS